MNMNLVKEVVADQLRNDLPELNVGDYVKVDVNIVEGDKKRIQSIYYRLANAGYEWYRNSQKDTKSDRK